MCLLIEERIVRVNDGVPVPDDVLNAENIYTIRGLMNDEADVPDEVSNAEDNYTLGENTNRRQIVARQSKV